MHASLRRARDSLYVSPTGLLLLRSSPPWSSSKKARAHREALGGGTPAFSRPCYPMGHGISSPISGAAQWGKAQARGPCLSMMGTLGLTHTPSQTHSPRGGGQAPALSTEALTEKLQSNAALRVRVRKSYGGRRYSRSDVQRQGGSGSRYFISPLVQSPKPPTAHLTGRRSLLRL